MAHTTNPNARDCTKPSEIANERPIGLTRIHSNDNVTHDDDGDDDRHEDQCARFHRELNNGRPTR